MNRIYLFTAINLLLSFSILAQQPSINISLYNTGARFELKRAPFGSQTPKLDSVKTIVFAADTFEVKKNAVGQDLILPSAIEIKNKIEANRPTDVPKKPTEQEIEKIKKNAAKRSCIIDTKGLKDKIVLIDFDKNCDPAQKCVQAQLAGAYAVIVIYDTNKKDSISMSKSLLSAAITIPCYSIIRQQGDSLRVMLPSKAAFFTPRPRPSQNSQLAQQNLINQQIQNNVSKEKATAVSEDPQDLTLNSVGGKKPILKLSPNPTRDIAYLNYGFPEATDFQVAVKNAVGQVIFTQILRGVQIGTVELNTQGWANNIYIVEMRFGKEVIRQKLVVQR